MQRARAPQARDPHDLSASESDRDRSQPSDPFLGPSLDDEPHDGPAAEREPVPAGAELDSRLHRLELPGVNTVVELPENRK